MVNGRANTRCKGLAIVEAALVFPVLLLLTFGVIHYGWLFLKAQQITNAARHGARVAIRPDATATQVTTEIAILMTDAGISGYDPPTITGISNGTGELVTVSLSVDIANVALMNTPLLPSPSTLGASVTMAKEGP
jgi:Flp pilus assembly protein TadG